MLDILPPRLSEGGILIPPHINESAKGAETDGAT
jgi:hypothetical protein